jgi:predicted amidohydrolase
MRIGLAQIQSLSGNLKHNFDRHIQATECALKNQCTLVVFPELSLINYEPTLAKETVNACDAFIKSFQMFSNDRQVNMLVGRPIQLRDGIGIGLTLIQANQKPSTYCKRYLHADELPYFTTGKEEVIWDLEERIAPAICYESTLLVHAAEAAKMKSSVYLASVAKSAAGIIKAQEHYASISKQHQWWTLLVNMIGSADNFIGAGGSAIWDAQGTKIACLDDKEAILWIDTITKTHGTDQL